MPIADLKQNQTLVRFKWSYDKDIVTIHGFFGYSVNPNDPVNIEKLKKVVAQARWKQLIARGFKHIGTYENGQQIK